ncbi:MAG: hypothetical protein IKZ43_00165, partial [Acidaminococcaceae bacterium]|nr:hypothetical protein [Acidaminococcaceae bacterium]
MNKIYKVVWSKVKNCYVVASELAKSHTKGSGARGLRRAAVTVGVTAALVGGISGSAWAADMSIYDDNHNYFYAGTNITFERIDAGYWRINATTYSAGNGLTLASNNKFSVVAGNGITVTSSGVAVKAESGKGLTVGTNGVAVQLATNKGLTVDANGIAVKAGNGITVDGNGVAVKAATGGHISVTSDGISVTTGSVESGSSGLVTGDTVYTALGSYATKAGAELTNVTISSGSIADAVTIGDSVTVTASEVVSAVNAVGSSSSGLIKDVSDLQTTVGDASSGLVKDVAGLQTTVGDANSGLVKDVALKADASSVYLKSETYSKTETDAAFAKVDASNLSDDNKTSWATALGTGVIAASGETNADELVKGSTVYDYLQGNNDHSLTLGNSSGKISIGGGSSAHDYSIAIGTNEVRTNDNDGNFVFNTTTTAHGNYSVAIGSGASTENDKSIALGYMAHTTPVGSVALGSNSRADRLAYDANAPYIIPFSENAVDATTPAWRSTRAAVSVGYIDSDDPTDLTKNVTRQITGVAAGSADTDAVNVAQLKAVASGGGVIEHYDPNAQTPNPNANKLVTGSTVYDYLQGNNDDHSLTLGNSSGKISIGGGSSAGADNTIAIGYNAQATVADSVALGSNSRANRAAYESTYEEAYLNEDGSKIPDPFDSATKNAWRSTHSAVAVGNDATVTRQITGLAAGSQDTDAVNVAQLKAVASGGGVIERYDPDALTPNPNANKLVTGSTVYDYLNATNLTLGENSTNISIGQDSSTNFRDGAIAIGRSAKTWHPNSIAIGTSAFASEADAIAIGTSASAGSIHAIAIGYSSFANGGDNGSALAIGDFALIGSVQQGYGHTVAIGDMVTILASNATAVGSNAKVNNQYGTSLGYKSIVSGDSGVALGANTQVSATAANSVAIGADSQAKEANVVSFGKDAVTGDNPEPEVTRRLVHVADGVGNTDAATVGQLNTAVSSVKTHFVGINGISTDTSYPITSDNNYNGAGAVGTNAIAIGRNTRASGANATALGDSASASSSNSIAIGYSSFANGGESGSAVAIGHGASIGSSGSIGYGHTVAIGEGATIMADYGTSLGYKSIVSGDSGVALGANTQVSATAANSVAIGSGSQANEANVVSFGHSATDTDVDNNEYGTALNRRLVHVAAGSADTDAVNVAQLKVATEINDSHNYYDGSSTAVKATDAVNAVDKALGKVEEGSNYLTEYNAATSTGTFAYNLTKLDTAIGKTTGGNYIAATDGTPAKSLAVQVQALDTAMGKVAEGSNYLTVYDAAITTPTGTFADNLKALDTAIGSMSGFASNNNYAKSTTSVATNLTALDNALGPKIADGTYNAIKGSSINSINTNIVALDNALGSINANVLELDNTIDGLNNTTAYMTANIQELHTEIDALQTDTEAITQMAADMSDYISSLNGDIVTLQDKTQNMSATSGTTTMKGILNVVDPTGGTTGVAISGAAKTITAGGIAIDGANNSLIVGGDSGITLSNATAGNTLKVGGDSGIIFSNATTGNTLKVGGVTVSDNGTAKTITGLSNKTWDASSITSGQAATEDQLKNAMTSVSGTLTNTGLKFAANSGDPVTNKLGSTVSVIGSDAQAGRTYSESNVTTVIEQDATGNSTITVKMDENP